MYCCFNDHVRIKKRIARYQEIRLYIESGVPERVPEFKFQMIFMQNPIDLRLIPPTGGSYFRVTFPLLWKYQSKRTVLGPASKWKVNNAL